MGALIPPFLFSSVHSFKSHEILEVINDNIFNPRHFSVYKL
nr:MAG TPA: hypothetical protein [Caudoviricetes sp.]